MIGLIINLVILLVLTALFCTHGNEYASSSYWQLMIPLRKRTFELSDKGKDLLLHLYLDTEEGIPYPYTGMRAYALARKPWVGHVDLKEKDFILKRTFGFLFKTHTSSFVVAGREIKKSNGIFIEIKISLSSFQLILFLLLLGSMTATVLFTSNTWEWFTQFCFIIFYVFSSLYGFKRTEDKIMWYLDKYCS